jgi:hypothetical protein
MTNETTRSSKMSIDELLNQQTSVGLTATVEPIADEPTLIKVTPFTPQAGCLCNLAMRVPKDTISHVISTGQAHFCCGKQLLIVEVHFRDDASLSPKTVFEQLHHAALSFRSPLVPLIGNCPYEGATMCNSGHIYVCKEFGGGLYWQYTSTPC